MFEKVGRHVQTPAGPCPFRLRHAPTCCKRRQASRREMQEHSFEPIRRVDGPPRSAPAGWEPSGCRCVAGDRTPPAIRPPSRCAQQRCADRRRSGARCAGPGHTGLRPREQRLRTPRCSHLRGVDPPPASNCCHSRRNRPRPVRRPREGVDATSRDTCRREWTEPDRDTWLGRAPRYRGWRSPSRSAVPEDPGRRSCRRRGRGAHRHSLTEPRCFGPQTPLAWVRGSSPRVTGKSAASSVTTSSVWSVDALFTTTTSQGRVETLLLQGPQGQTELLGAVVSGDDDRDVHGAPTPEAPGSRSSRCVGCRPHRATGAAGRPS